MKKRILFACFILLAVLFISGTVYVKQLMVQASETKEQEADQVKETQKEHVKSRVTLKEEFTVLKEHNTEKKPLNEEFNGIIPTNVTIPSIDVNASIEQVGLLDNGEMAAPFTEEGVAWFEPGSKPGVKGNAVLAGHVDSKTGPAVFYHLKDLAKGDEITVKDKQGTKLTFVVKQKQSYPRDKAPLNEIFGYSKGRHLNLITCTGTFDRLKGTHQERLVVYAELKTEEEKQLENKAKPPATPTNAKISGDLLTWYAVSDGNIIGYRVYKKQPGGTFTHIGSISEYERKNFVDKNATNAHYYVTAVNEYGQESAPSSFAK
ncbi:hypothetical protein SRABI96_03186 [Peribacillus sp. Bi96]|uniref:class F sortase n=1 Tax=unclassified Peribacillus TaxID=2675266 RepID=UPI001D28F941|nr:class F sortase [Peribacillus sp. Bi96]CAH0251331.1 hypothetical protein SRABI96_03186 [Peribacillus sp. Bi96]